MEPRYDHKKFEKEIYSLWEKGDYFTAKRDPKKKPYTIVLPPPNASGKMHIGNVLMIAIEDLLIRWKRMQGYSALWIPGTDHAGFETQLKFEKKLAKEGKSRFDFDRTSLYNAIWEFVAENKGLIEEQIRRMGASVDWSRYTFTLDPEVIDTVLNTFEKLHQDNLVYKDDYMVNYCPNCGTTFADLEVVHLERTDPLYFVNYPIYGDDSTITVATVRPETMFGDTAIAVHPKDTRYKKLIGKTAVVPLTTREIPIIADAFVDKEFGTGAVKITPAHDPNDYEAGKRHNLEFIPVLDFNGRMKLPNDANLPEIEGKKAKTAREIVAQKLQAEGFIEKIDDKYNHAVTVCYKANHDIEPTILPNWFVKVASLKKPAHQIVKDGGVKIYPKWQEKKYHRWMETMHDWPISRQVVWGIQIPAWYNSSDNPDILVTYLSSKGETVTGTIGDLLQKTSINEIKKGLQTLIAPKNVKYIISKNSPGDDFIQETDTFDTWFSSGQWPLVTLGYPNSPDYKYFYPTSVLETGWEILRFWVSRMIMFGMYLTDMPPFTSVYLHGMVRAVDGKKMSKSLGNEIVPEEYQEEFGTDALRMGLIAGTANGKDFAFPKDKVLAYRNFSNKVWNMARFILLMFEKHNSPIPFYEKSMTEKLKADDIVILEKLNEAVAAVNKSLEKYRFAEAADIIYHFMWDSLASSYIEQIKDRSDSEVSLGVLRHVYLYSLKLLHPFMPFITESIWQELKDLRKYPEEMLIVAPWPKTT